MNVYQDCLYTSNANFDCFPVIKRYQYIIILRVTVIYTGKRPRSPYNIYGGVDFITGNNNFRYWLHNFSIFETIQNNW